MASITPDNVDISELKKQLIGKAFIVQAPSGYIRHRTIKNVSAKMKVMRHGKLKKTFFNVEMFITDDRDRDYPLNKIWMDSKMKYVDHGEGVMVSHAVSDLGFKKTFKQFQHKI